MKIRKNLSDEDMLKGYEEEVSFENAVYGDEPVKNKKIKIAKNAGGKEILLPEEALEKLNRYLLELSMDWFKNTKGEADWKVYKENGQIIPKAKQTGKFIKKTGRLLLNLPQPKRNPDGIKFNFTAGKFYIKEQC